MPMEIRSLLRICLTPAVLVGALLVAVLLMAFTFLLVVLARPSTAPSQPGTAVVKIISAPTITPKPATPQPLPSPSLQTSSDAILIGSSVTVTGTGGDGLRLRYSAGLESKVRMLAPEGTLFQVMDGPQQIDNYVWWYLENPQDRSQRGWAVANFLSPSSSH